MTFRVVPFWTEDGAVNTLAQEQAPIRLSAVTDADGLANAAFPAFDAVRDIHFAYTIDAFAEAAPGQASCVSASRCELAMTPYRRCRHPYPAYFAENTLYLSPELEKRSRTAAAGLRRKRDGMFPQFRTRRFGRHFWMRAYCGRRRTASGGSRAYTARRRSGRCSHSRMATGISEIPRMRGTQIINRRELL